MMKRLTLVNEEAAYKQGYKYVAGIDEAGRGPLAGPVVAACVVLPKDYYLEGLTDSKKLSKKKREYYFEIIKKDALAIGIGIVNADLIDEINILEATKLAMLKSIRGCCVQPDYLLVDAVKLNSPIDNLALIKGDLVSHSISAASVIAKVSRDRIMNKLDEEYPVYDFKNNAAYPTKAHLAAIEKYGITKEHRKTYGPVKKYLEKL